VLPRISATRYVAPLREGGSLPGIVEADDYGTYVMKFVGAGQGRKVLVAEVIVAELAGQLGLRVPSLAAIDLCPDIARYEADEEVQDLLNASVGQNLGVDFLPGSFGWHPSFALTSEEAARVLWLDAFTANVDRSWRNPNLLIWHQQLWLIDHGACLYFHHGWDSPTASPERFARQPFDSSDHVLVAHRGAVAELDAELAAMMTPEAIAAAIDEVPDEWLSAPADRDRYRDYLVGRIDGPRSWLPVESAA